MKNLLLLLLLSIPCFAQSVVKPLPSEPLTPEESELVGAIMVYEGLAQTCDMLPALCKNKRQELALVYSQIAKSPKVVRALTAKAVTEYQELRTSNITAAQASQIANEQNAKLIPLLIIQNQRIIELLEVIAKKPR